MEWRVGVVVFVGYYTSMCFTDYITKKKLWVTKKTVLKIFNRQQYMCFDSTSQLDFLIIIVFDYNIETFRGDMHRNSQFPRKSVRNMILPPVLHT